MVPTHLFHCKVFPITNMKKIILGHLGNSQILGAGVFQVVRKVPRKEVTNRLGKMVSPKLSFMAHPECEFIQGVPYPSLPSLLVLDYIPLILYWPVVWRSHLMTMVKFFKCLVLVTICLYSQGCSGELEPSQVLRLEVMGYRILGSQMTWRKPLGASWLT